jgi:hypothetical protein
MDHSNAERTEQPALKPAVNCPVCKRLFNVPAGHGAGAVLSCPFCSAQMVLRERTMLVAEPVVQA